VSRESKIIILEQGLRDGQGKELAAPLTKNEQNILLGMASNSPTELSDLLPGSLYLAGTGSSSFDLAHELIRLGIFSEWSAVILVNQLLGRGQLRRRWISQFGNLFVSYRLPDLNCHENAIPVVTGLLWALGLAKLGYRVQLKWPNDLIQINAQGLEKVGGILIEERNQAVVAGVGLNLRQAPPKANMREYFALSGGILRKPALSLNSDLLAFYADKQGIAHFWTKLATAMFSCYSVKSDNDRDWWRPLAEGILACSGSPVEIIDHSFGRSIRGVVAGLHHDGSLLLNTGKGIISINGGSLHPLGAV